MIGVIRTIHESTLPADTYQPHGCTHPDLPALAGPVSDELAAEWRYLAVGTAWSCPECGVTLTVVSLQSGGRVGVLERWWMNTGDTCDR